MNRTAFLVDGFNLYHSLVDASRDLGGVGTKWLDIRAFCSSYLSLIGGDAQVSRIVYFSALATFRDAEDPGVTTRHRAYLQCLHATGIDVELGVFKAKSGRCHGCGNIIRGHEEKETDVAIGSRLLELSWTNQCDSIVLVTGDSDFGPAVRIARQHFPARPIYCCFPYKRFHFVLETGHGWISRKGPPLRSVPTSGSVLPGSGRSHPEARWVVERAY